MTGVELGLTAGFLILLVWLSWVDFKTGYLPDILQVGLALLGLLALLVGSPIDVGWGPAIIGAVGAAAVFYALRWAVSVYKKREAMGLGDVKLIANAGLWLGWWDIAYVMLAAGVVTLVGGMVAALITKKPVLQGEMPLGPGLALGMAVVYLVRLIDGPSLFTTLY